MSNLSDKYAKTSDYITKRANLLRFAINDMIRLIPEILEHPDNRDTKKRLSANIAAASRILTDLDTRLLTDLPELDKITDLTGKHDETPISRDIPGIDDDTANIIGKLDTLLTAFGQMERQVSSLAPHNADRFVSKLDNATTDLQHLFDDIARKMSEIRDRAVYKGDF